MTTNKLRKLVNEELAAWKPEFRDKARIVLVCFAHRLLTGEPIDAMFKPAIPPIDYQI